MLGFFKKNKNDEPEDKGPEIMGLRLGGSFKLDSLLLKLVENDLIIEEANPTHIIKAAGIADLDGTKILRFYTDDEAFLQVIVEGALKEENVVDVKLFYFYDTQTISNQAEWDDLLNNKIGKKSYKLEGHKFKRVWTSTSDYHPPVGMTETTYSEDEDEPSETDQFTMLFERQIQNDKTESLFLSAEEVIVDNNYERCLVISTGFSLGSTDITIIG